jgi:mono/diheme cytochrome c family protein
MMRRAAAVASLLAACWLLPGLLSAAHGAAVPDPLFIERPRSNYLLGCGGCHGEQGVSNSKLVPDLRSQVGYFLAEPEGRSYIARLPNVAFNTSSDQDLADVLNYVIFSFGGASTPKDSRPYTAVEVAELRRHPLTEVSLLDYRNHLVDTLITRHGAPQTLRYYSASQYP